MAKDKTQKGLAWVIVDAMTGEMVVSSGHCPVYWRLRVAQDEANDHGLTWHGPDADVHILRCVVKVL